MASFVAQVRWNGRRTAGSLCLFLVCALSLIGLIVPPAAAAASPAYYVDKTVSACSNTGPGDASTPYCSLVTGVSHLQPGYTLYIGDGTYAEMIQPSVSGTSTNPVTITRWPGRSPTIAGSGTYGANVSNRAYVVITDLVFNGTVRDGIRASGSNNLTISGNIVRGAGKPQSGGTASGINVASTSSSAITGNTTEHNNGHGMAVTGSSTGDTIADNVSSFNAEGWRRNGNGINVTAPGNSVLRNMTHDNEDSGIQFYPGGNNNLAALNVTYNNGDHGIDDLNVTGGRLISNTVFRNCTTGINVEGSSGNYTVMNNIAVDNAVYPAYDGIKCSRRNGNIGIWDSAPPTTAVDHNLVWLSTAGKMYVFKNSYTSLAAMQAATGQEAHGVEADPAFAGPVDRDLRITAGSAAIDRADSGVFGAQPSDILGNPRVDDPNTANTFASGPRRYDDIGAYEYQSGSAPDVSPPSARLTVSPTSGTAPLQVTADASASSDPQGQSLSYAFDFGDGTTTGSHSSATASHSYTAPGGYSLTVTVTNSSGLSSVQSRAVTVDPPAAAAPTARLSVSPTSGSAPLQVTADASASSDPQGQALSYAFDFGDGTRTGAQQAPTAGHSYTAPGGYSLTVTVTNSSGLSSVQSRAVTVDPPAAAAPTARLSVSPTSGSAPLQVTADASASSDPQGQALSYDFDFGDGTRTGAQQAPTAGHSYTSAGSYALTVTVTNTSGLSDNLVRTVSVSQPTTAPPSFVNTVANNYSTSTKTSGYITVWRSAGVSAGDLVVLTLQLTGTSPNGSVSATDAAGNSYTQAASVSDGSGNRLILLTGVLAHPLGVNDRITASFPSATSYRLGGEEFAGVTGVDTTSGATGSTSSFSSGTAPATVGNEIAFGAVSIPVGSGAPAWASGWKNVSAAATGSRYLGRAYRLPVSGPQEASGTATGSWLAALLTLRP